MEGEGGRGAMAARGRIPPYMILLVVAFALVGFVGFQTLKERKNASAILVAKDSEVEKIKEQHDVRLLLLYLLMRH